MFLSHFQLMTFSFSNAIQNLPKCKIDIQSFWAGILIGIIIGILLILSWKNSNEPRI